MKNFWCYIYGWYVSVGDWMVKQVDTNDWFAGFLMGWLFTMLYVTHALGY